MSVRLGISLLTLSVQGSGCNVQGSVSWFCVAFVSPEPNLNLEPDLEQRTLNPEP